MGVGVLDTIARPVLPFLMLILPKLSQRHTVQSCLRSLSSLKLPTLWHLSIVAKFVWSRKITRVGSGYFFTAVGIMRQ